MLHPKFARYGAVLFRISQEGVLHEPYQASSLLGEEGKGIPYFLSFNFVYNYDNNLKLDYVNSIQY